MKSRVRPIATSNSRPFRFSGRAAKGAAREDRLGRILGNCVAVVAILGIPIGLCGYYAGEHTKRVQNTFEFYKDFRSQAFQDKYQALINGAEKKDDEIDRIMTRLRDNVQERDQQVIAVITELAEAGDAPKNMSAALLFFDGLAACVKDGLCDRNAAVALFQGPSRELASAYGPYILFIRAKYKNDKYGTGLFQTRALEIEWSVF
jgi:hypothetical protein